MLLNEKTAAVEAILFASGDAVDEKRIAESTQTETTDVEKIIRILNDRYDSNMSALTIIHIENKYQMCTRKEYADYIKAAMESKKQTPLSNAAMEALTIIAYNQPVTKAFVESVRGIDSSSVINSLVEKGLLDEDSRLNVPGRPISYKTNENFLRCFGLSSLDDLPPLVREDENNQGSLFEEETDNNNIE